MRRPSTGMLAWRCRPLSHTHTHTSSCSSPYPRAPLYITEDAPHPHKHAVLPLSRGSTLRGLSAGPQHFVTRVNTPTAENHGGGSQASRQWSPHHGLPPPSPRALSLLPGGRVGVSQVVFPRKKILHVSQSMSETHEEHGTGPRWLSRPRSEIWSWERLGGHSPRQADRPLSPCVCPPVPGGGLPLGTGATLYQEAPFREGSV